MSPEHAFGGNWTDEKLKRLAKYLHAYTTIFRGNPKARMLTTTYVDAFAGTGYRTRGQRLDDGTMLFKELSEPESVKFLKGSARIALEVEPPFANYIFIEKDSEHAAELEKLEQEFPQKAATISIVRSDANEYLKHWCRTTNWASNRAVVFLDPYGMEVEWPLVEAIAQTQAIDLWLLFPLGIAVNRLLTRRGPPSGAWADRLDRMFGTPEWRREFYSHSTERTLFGPVQNNKKRANFEKIGAYFVSRLKEVFHAVEENPLPLCNRKNVPLYLLCFAAGNPKGAPTAVKIARHLLKR